MAISDTECCSGVELVPAEQVGLVFTSVFEAVEVGLLTDFDEFSSKLCTGLCTVGWDFCTGFALVLVGFCTTFPLTDVDFSTFLDCFSTGFPLFLVEFCTDLRDFSTG